MLLWICTWTLKRGINSVVKIWTVEWNEETSSRFESGNGITKENPNLGKTGKEKVRNWKSKLRGKTINMIQKTEDRILGIVDKIEELCNSLRESINTKISHTKYSGCSHMNLCIYMCFLCFFFCLFSPIPDRLLLIYLILYYYPLAIWLLSK